MDKYILLILGWAGYFFLHSLLASNSVKKSFENLLGKFFRFYRLFYSFISIVGLFLMLLLNGSIPSSQLITTGNITRYFSLMLATVGVLIIKAAFKQYSLGGFLGLKNDSEEKIQSDGILNHIRHPLYSGTILLVIGFWLFSPNITTLISVGCIFIYLPIGIYLEEKKLISKYGEAYLDYKKKIPALIPKIKF